MVFLVYAETVCLLVYAGAKSGPSFYGRNKTCIQKLSTSLFVNRRTLNFKLMKNNVCICSQVITYSWEQEWFT